MRVQKKSKFRRFTGWLHLWLGLVSGIVVFVVSITGCLFSFQEEISNLWYKKTFFIEAKNERAIPVDQLQNKVQIFLGQSKPINAILINKSPDRAWEFMSYAENEKALTYFGAIPYFESVFINPYNGEITGSRNYKFDFFNIVKYIHWNLLLNTSFGQPIVGWCTLIFVVLLISGLILWFPRKWNKTNKKQAFSIRWKAKSKRLNYDLHNVFGFYSFLLALVLAVTGMVFAFNWFQRFVYIVASRSTEAPSFKEINSNIGVGRNAFVSPVNTAYSSAIKEMPDAKRLSIYFPETKEDALTVYGYRNKDVYYNFDMIRYDQYSGKLLQRRNHSEKNRGEKLIEMNYDIHVGAIGGIAGKIIAFIISLICASLPLTGFIVWLNKRKKKVYMSSGNLPK